MLYHVSFNRRDVPQANLIEAPTAEIARAYFAERKPDAIIYAVEKARSDDMKPGKPVIKVPDDYNPNATKEDKPMTNTYAFAPDSLTVNGKTFRARYELQEADDMKRGQTIPTVFIFATVDEKTVKIAVPGDDDHYPAALAACNAAQEETPADPSEEAPAQPEETPADASDEAPTQPEGTPVDPSEAAPAQPEEAPAAPAEAAPVQPEEAPARDPKQARGPVPEKAFIGTCISGTRYKIIFDGDAQRTRVIIPAEYKDAARATIEKAGFYYSAPLDSWNKKLTFRAYRAAQALAMELDKIFAA